MARISHDETTELGRGAGRPVWRRPSAFVGLLAAVALLAAACSDDDTASGSSSDDSIPDGAVGTVAITEAAVDGSFGELDTIVEDAMDETGVPGVALAVVFQDEVVYEQGYGVRSTETDELVDPETVFQVASLSKALASTVVAGAVSDGTIAWDEPIAEAAPGHELSDAYVTENVTYADLFAHRSGLPGGSAGNDLETIGYDRDEILARLVEVPLDPFRSTYSYSNYGLTLGGVAAAEAEGTTWEQLAEDQLYEPLGMDSTSSSQADFEAAENRADLHVQVEGEWVPEFERFPDPQSPAGGVSSNVVDLAEWMRLHLAGGAHDGEPVIDEEALAETHLPAIVTRPPMEPGGAAAFYGYGWNVETDEVGAVRWGHSGAFSLGASTVVRLIPAEDLGIVVLTNGAPIGVPEAIADAYLELLQTGEQRTDWVAVWGERFSGIYGEPADLPTPDDPTEALPEDAYVGTYANDYVGEVTVREGDDGLEVVMGPAEITYQLEHWDGNTFTYVHDPELPEFLASAEFEVGPDGTTTSVTLSAFDASGLGTLQRT